MVSRICRDISFNDTRFQTSVNPLGIGIFFKPGSADSEYVGAGYLFGGYERMVSISGARNENIFWDFCTDCPLYNTRTCSGGYKVLSASPGTNRMVVKNKNNATINLHYNKEFCTQYYGSSKLSNALNGIGSMPVNLLPHFMCLKGNERPYWYLFKPNEAGDALQFMEYQIFNTWESGEMCFGERRISDKFSIPCRYETFLSGRMNNDLNPTRRHTNSMRPAEWARQFTPEALGTYQSSSRWKTSEERFGRDTLFVVLPPSYKKVKFLNIRTSNLPSTELMPTGRLYMVAPFVQDYEDNWYCTYDLNTVLTTDNTNRDLINFLRG